jgi:hypothetical protein
MLLISDGYETWVWDGAQAHGGWANAHAIYDVRPAYGDRSLSIWRNLTGPLARAKREKDIVEAEAGDEARAADDPLAYLPGPSARLVWMGEQRPWAPDLRSGQSEHHGSAASARPCS